MLPYEILEIVDRELFTQKFTTECSAAYILTVRTFVREHIIQPLAEARESRGMFSALERSDEYDAETLSLGADGMSLCSLQYLRINGRLSCLTSDRR